MARRRRSLARRVAVRLALLACSLLVSRMVLHSDAGRAAMQGLQTALLDVIQTEMQARRAASGPATEPAALAPGIAFVPAADTERAERPRAGTMPESRVPVRRMMDGGGARIVAE